MPKAEEKQTSENPRQPDSVEATATAPAPQPAVQVRDTRKLPEGVVPKQAQAYVIAGLALLILLAVLFSKNHARTVPQQPATASAAISNNANQQRIHELEQNLSADQRQSQQQQQAQAQKASTTAVPGSTAPASGAAQTSNVNPAEPLQAPAQPPRDPIADAERALAFKARFASNLVGPVEAASTAATNSTSAAAHSELPQQAPAAQTAAAGKHAPEVNIDAAHGRPYVIFEGTTIDTVLTNRLDSDFAGPVKVMVTNPVYSRDRQHVLIPAGTFILGSTQKVGTMGQTRLAVTFHRMIMPDGYSVDLDQFRGLDQIGDTGLKDKVNHHYLQIFGASIALGVIAGAAESTTYGGYTESGSDMYRQGVASSLSQSSGDVLDRFINIPPNEGVKTLLQAFRSKVFLSTSDPETARYASEICGKTDRTAISYTVSESSTNANVGWLSGRTSSSRGSVSASKQYQKRKEPLFEEKVFFDLKNAQAVVVAFDGVTPLPPTYCYLKPDFLPVTMTWFDQERIAFDPRRIRA